jgi:hypothetical protein
LLFQVGNAELQELQMGTQAERGCECVGCTWSAWHAVSMHASERALQPVAICAVLMLHCMLCCEGSGYLGKCSG